MGHRAATTNCKAQTSYFKDTFALKDLLDKLRLTPNERFWKADATAMYTNIKTPPALSEISAYLRREEGVSFHHYRSQTLIDALNIVFKHNFLKFGDTYWRQKSGTGMGISPAPPWATIFFGLYEEQLLSKWNEHVVFYKRFIDDVLGTWRSHPCPIRDRELWDEFCYDLNQWHGLEWECEVPSTMVNFMDLTIIPSLAIVLKPLSFKNHRTCTYICLPTPHTPRGKELV